MPEPMGDERLAWLREIFKVERRMIRIAFAREALEEVIRLRTENAALLAEHRVVLTALDGDDALYLRKRPNLEQAHTAAEQALRGRG